MVQEMGLHNTIGKWGLVLRKNSNDHDKAVQMRAYIKNSGKKSIDAIGLFAWLKQINDD